MPQGAIIPNNSILVAGQPIIREMEAKTITQFCPGKLVIYDTNDYSCTYAGAAAPDVLGVADVPSDKKLTDYYTASAAGTVTEAFTAGDQIRVLRGPIRVKVILKSGETVTPGESLVAAANGMVAACTGDSGSPEDIVGKAASSSSASGTCDWILMDMTI